MFFSLLSFAAVAILVMSQNDSLNPFPSGGKYGFRDDDGVVRVAARYDQVKKFAEGLAAVGKVRGRQIYRGGEAGKNCFEDALKWGFIDADGREVIPLKYDEVESFSDGRAPVRSGARWGFIDAAGREIIPLKYDEVDDFSEGRAAVRAGDKWGFVDQKGRSVIAPQFAEAGEFRDGLAYVRIVEDGPAGFIDVTGAFVIAPRDGWRGYDAPDGLLLLQHRDRGSELRDPRGRVLLQRRGNLSPLGEGIVAYQASQRGLYGLMDLQGTTLSPPAWEHIRPFSESRAAARKRQRWDFIDRTGATVIPLAAEWVGDFREGLADVKIDGRVGYVNRAGRMVIAPTLWSGHAFSGGLAAVCLETRVPGGRYEQPDLRCGFIDRTGNFVIGPHFSRVSNFDGGFAAVDDPLFGRMMMVDRHGRIHRPDEGKTREAGPYGDCQYPGPPPPPAPPPPDYRVDFAVSSRPAGASVYLVPLWDWQRAQGGARLLENAQALEAYRVTMGVTPLDKLRLKSQAYMGVFDLRGKRKVVSVQVTPSGPRSVQVQF